MTTKLERDMKLLQVQYDLLVGSVNDLIEVNKKKLAELAFDRHMRAERKHDAAVKRAKKKPRGGRK